MLQTNPLILQLFILDSFMINYVSYYLSNVVKFHNDLFNLEDSLLILNQISQVLIKLDPKNQVCLSNQSPKSFHLKKIHPFMTKVDL